MHFYLLVVVQQDYYADYFAGSLEASAAQKGPPMATFKEPEPLDEAGRASEAKARTDAKTDSEGAMRRPFDKRSSPLEESKKGWGVSQLNKKEPDKYKHPTFL